MRLHNWGFDDPPVMDRVFGNLLEETGTPSSWPAVLRQLDPGVGGKVFDTLPRRVELKQTESYEAGGVTHIGYRVIP